MVGSRRPWLNGDKMAPQAGKKSDIETACPRTASQVDLGGPDLGGKFYQRWNGPYVVIKRNRGGAYVIAELNGAVFDRPVAAFRLIPYLARESIFVPDSALDLTDKELRAVESLDVGEEVDFDEVD